MEIKEALSRISDQPISRQVILSLLKDYNNPNDKIYNLVSQDVLQPLKRGMYITGAGIQGNKPEPVLIANHLTGPSYVTSDTALSYYGLIPERVYAIISATTRFSVEYRSSVGLFIYKRLTLPWYAYGITQQPLTSRQHALMASPEKAVLDKIILTSALRVRSVKQALELLLDDLRMNESILKGLNWKEPLSWLSKAPKKESLRLIIEALQSL